MVEATPNTGSLTDMMFTPSGHHKIYSVDGSNDAMWGHKESTINKGRIHYSSSKRTFSNLRLISIAIYSGGSVLDSLPFGESHALHFWGYQSTTEFNLRAGRSITTNRFSANETPTYSHTPMPKTAAAMKSTLLCAKDMYRQIRDEDEIKWEETVDHYKTMNNRVIEQNFSQRLGHLVIGS